MSQHEITFAEWNACVAAGGCDGYEPYRSGWEGDSRPAINVSWEDAQRYVDWLSRVTAHEYRLLSEAEWEYAARAGSKGQYSWGDNAPICELAASNGAMFGIGDGACGDLRPRETASFRVNAFGLHDMHGNVWEWVEDCYISYDAARRSAEAVKLDRLIEIAAPQRPGVQLTCSRVLRGGSWTSGHQALRSASRLGSSSTSRRNDVGFRVARTLRPESSL